MLARVAPLLRAMDDDALVAMGYPPETLAFARLHDGRSPELRIARIDAIRTATGFRAIEINADTPAFVVESYAANGAACAAAGMSDPNAGELARYRATLLAAIRAVHAATGSSRPPRVVFTADDRFVEDRETMRFARAAVTDAIDARYVPLGALRVDDRTLRDENDARIDVLVRLWPIELFARDRDVRTGEALGPRLFALAARGRLGLVNPPSGFLLQNKSVFALVRALAERGAFFDAAERAAIARSFAPTAYAPSQGEPYVRKPAFGREGVGVAFSTDPAAVESAADEACVYQPLLDPPVARYDLDDGPRDLVCVHSCFLLDGRPSAIGLRVGEGRVDGRARFAPLGLASTRTKEGATPRMRDGS